MFVHVLLSKMVHSVSLMKKVRLVNYEDNKIPPCQMSALKMLFLSFILVFPITICGMSTSFPGVALPQMKLEMSHASSFGSVLQLSAPVGAILVGFIIDKYGRRSALLFSIVPSIAGWFILFLDLDTEFSIAGQLLNGIMVGAVGYPSQVYAGECIMVDNVPLRNSFLAWIGISNAFGMFLVYVLGYYLDYKQISALATIFSVISFALTYICIPESPSWLHLKGRSGDAEWSQKKLGLCNPLLENAHPHFSAVTCEELDLSPFHMSVNKLKRKDVWKPLLIGTMLTVLLSLNGGTPIITYMVDIIGTIPSNTTTNILHSTVTTGNGNNITNITNVTSMTNSSNVIMTNLSDESARQSYALSIISGALMFLSNILMSFMLPCIGVKKILILPLIGMAIGMFLEGFTAINQSDSAFFVIHISAIWFITFMYSFSLIIVPDSMLGDLFPIDAKGFASIPYLFEGIVTALTCKLHPYLADTIGGGIYYIYAFMCVISAIFVKLFIPEIVGKTLHEINEGFL